MLSNNLAINNLSQSWLQDELRKLNINDSQEVAFAAIASTGRSYVDLYKDRAWEEQ